MDQLANYSDDPKELRQQLLGSFNEFEASFRKKYPVIWLTTLIGPLLITIALLIFFGLTMGWAYPQKLIYHAFLTAVILGRFVILVGMEGEAHDSYNISMQPYELFGLVTYLDFMVALFVAFDHDHFHVRHMGAGRIGAMRRAGNQADIACAFATAFVVGADDQKPGILALST